MKKIFLLIILVILLSGNKALASDISIQGKPEVFLGEVFEMSVLIKADNSVNAVSGSIIFDPKLLSIELSKTGGSIVKYWLKNFKTISPGRVDFSGLIPGGFKGDNGKIVTLYFKSLKTGTGNVGVNNARVLLNDGSGSADKVSIINKSIKILPIKNEKKIWNIKDLFSDASAPENFVASIIKTDKVFRNRYFLAFNAEDTDSGIGKYYILESKIKIPLDTLYDREDIKWLEIENPALLKDQKLKSYIYVKSTDKVGNEKIIEIIPTDSISGDTLISKVYKIVIILVSLGLLVFGLSKIISHIHRKRLKAQNGSN